MEDKPGFGAQKKSPFPLKFEVFEVYFLGLPCDPFLWITYYIYSPRKV